MNEWIECNLSWSTARSKEYDKKVFNIKEVKKLEKILEKKCIKYFGFKYEDSDKTVEDIHYDNFDMEKYNDIKDNYIKKHKCSKLEAYKALDGKVINDDPRSLMLTKHRIFILEYDEWEAQQEEFKLKQEIIDKAYEKADKEELGNNPSFCRLGLNKPGTLIEYVDSGGNLIQELIGHMNTSSGVCDDCRAFGDKQIIKRYKIVWEGEKS